MVSQKSQRMTWWYSIVLLACTSSALERVRIDPSTGHYVGTDGRTLLFHGVNVVQKSFPWHPSLGEFDIKTSLNAEDMSNLRSWGFNVVRLGVMWPGVEPSIGQYNETYLQVMRKLADDLYSHGIYTIVDFHQDSFSEQWCGEGLPAWMIKMLAPLQTSCSGLIERIGQLIGQCTPFKDFHIPIDNATGFPSSAGCLDRTFDAYSRTPELVSAWGHFYSNEDIQQKFRAFWGKVASTFSGCAGVLGYDLINEPLNGNFFDDPNRLRPGYHDEHVLQPMYQALYKVVKSADPDAIIMYEPPPFPDTYPSNIPFLHGVHATGFKSGPSGLLPPETDVAHQALSYHIYSCGFAVENCSRKGDTTSPSCPVCDEYADKAVSTRTADAKRLGGGAFLTEFGACSGSEACIAEINRVLNRADMAMQSWAYWEFKFNHDITTVSGPVEGFYSPSDGTLQHAKVAALSRTYAPAVAGLPLQTQFEPTTGTYRLKYVTEDATAHLQTDIFLNEEMNYDNAGYTVSVLNATYNKTETNRLSVLSTKADLEVDIAITKKHAGATAGTTRLKGNNGISWSIIENDANPGLDFSVLGNLTFQNKILVYTDDGDLLCTLETQRVSHGPLRCDFHNEHRHAFLFTYRIEFWMANSLGSHVLVDTIPSSYLGPLLQTRVDLTWVNDGAGVRDENIII